MMSPSRRSRIPEDGVTGAVFVLTTLLAVAVLTGGCGRKASPVPPRHRPPPVVHDLSGRVAGDRLILTWTLPASTEDTGEAAEVVVYRFRSVAGDAICPACPPIFTPAATVPVDAGGDAPRAMETRIPLEKGFRYLFKLVVRGEDGVLGGDSNFFKVVLPEDGSPAQ